MEPSEEYEEIIVYDDDEIIEEYVDDSDYYDEEVIYEYEDGGIEDEGYEEVTLPEESGSSPFDTAAATTAAAAAAKAGPEGASGSQPTTKARWQKPKPGSTQKEEAPLKEHLAQLAAKRKAKYGYGDDQVVEQSGQKTDWKAPAEKYTTNSPTPQPKQAAPTATTKKKRIIRKKTITKPDGTKEVITTIIDGETGEEINKEQITTAPPDQSAAPASAPPSGITTAPATSSPKGVSSQPQPQTKAPQSQTTDSGCACTIL